MEPFRNFTSIRKPRGSGLKRVAAGNVSERYQTCFCAKFSNHLFDNVKVFFDPFGEIIIIQKAASKITRYGVKLQRENVFAVSSVERKPGNDPKTKMKTGIFHNHQDNSSVPKYQK